MRGTAPIGVFDSGVGGLSVLREIRALLPNESAVYVADSGHVPYGNKSTEYIRERSLALSGFLLEHGAKAVVIACNTATAAAAAFLRSTSPVPVVAMEPAVKPAAAATQTGVIGVLATVGTLQSAQLAALLDRFGQGVNVVTQPAPGLVELVEAGDLNGPAPRALVERYTTPLLRAGADTIVLGCTHYPFLRQLIADVVGPSVTLIDTGAAVARQLERVLETHHLRNRQPAPATDEYWTSGDARVARPVFAGLLERPVVVRKLPQSVG